MAKTKKEKTEQDMNAVKKEPEIKRGKFEFSNGCLVYEGEYICIDTSPEVKGEKAGGNGAELKPIIKRHGHGTQVGNGEAYVGQWLDDEIHGQGAS
jgi:hypothetical protein